MPLASVDEWRARIGSCWCALGRPFKTSKSSGNYRSFAALSGSAVEQAVYALMAMVLALTRDTAVVVFVQGVESIHGCVNECQRQIKSEFMQADSVATVASSYKEVDTRACMWARGK
jgi:hypothetical protein